MLDYQVELEGTTDFSKAFDFALNGFKELFSNEVGRLLTQGVSEGFSELVNGLLYK